MKFNSNNSKLNYDEPIELNNGVYWIGFVDNKHSLQCNPYIIIEGDEAVLIDGGSRPDFSKIMMKILQIGLEPSIITRLIYHHYDPDLCGSISNFEEIIGNEDLKIISHSENNIFIKHYSVSSPLLSITNMNYEFIFKTGRKLKFITTPYSHSPGSFITFDEKSGILFSSDLFGSYDMKQALFLQMDEDCSVCNDYTKCGHGSSYCALNGIFYFQRKIMTSEKALKIALDKIKKLNAKVVAPQHGSIINNEKSIKIVIEKLQELKGIGIDGYIQSDGNE
ncbi:MAG: MBL fold metallo-hydrolase [Clostridiaceae bacterium]|nr:MBL fold metallo-hydrolase [Clostridiaceae bacterium]